MVEGAGVVTVKGTEEGLMVHVAPEASMDELLTHLKEKFQGEAQFFQAAELVLDLGMRPFQEDEFQSLRDVLDESGIRLKGILSDNPITKLLAQNDGITLLGNRSIMSSRVRVDHPVKTQRLRAMEMMPPPSASTNHERNPVRKGTALFIKKTVRAGQKVHFIGDITVLGDVNPGAEIVATGNIAVFGALRGVAHAGAEGAKDAIVLALELVPTQLRIADCIARAPERKQNSVNVPELARVREGQITIEPYERN